MRIWHGTKVRHPIKSPPLGTPHVDREVVIDFFGKERGSVGATHGGLLTDAGIADNSRGPRLYQLRDAIDRVIFRLLL